MVRSVHAPASTLTLQLPVRRTFRPLVRSRCTRGKPVRIRRCRATVMPRSVGAGTASQGTQPDKSRSLRVERGQTLPPGHHPATRGGKEFLFGTNPGIARVSARNRTSGPPLRGPLLLMLAPLDSCGNLVVAALVAAIGRIEQRVFCHPTRFPNSCCGVVKRGRIS